MEDGKFFNDVYRIVKKISSGKVATYGQIARILGTRDARRIGHALHANKDSKTPCHRVVNKDGKLAPGFAFGGPGEQKRCLLSEGVGFKDEMHVDLEKHIWKIKQ
jgi:methylated-DNA-protein-cysteine methyltransferase-like protein